MKTLILPVTLTLLAACTSNEPDAVDNKLPETELSIPAAGHEFQLLQRTNKALPTKSGKASVSINDITGGQTWLTIANDTIVVLEKSIHEGDTVQFELSGNQYRLTCLEMINELIGQDLVTLKVMK